MYSGIHYILRDRGDGSQIYYPTQFYDPFNINYEINVNPVGCIPSQPCNTSQVTLLNKRRETLVFDVAVMLNMRNIIIDSLDSILPSAT